LEYKRGTTDPITLNLNGIDLTNAEWLIVTVKPIGLPAIEFTKDKLSLASDGTNTVIIFRLNEEQSVGLDTESITIDCNWMIDGSRGGATPVTFTIEPTLLTRVVENE